MAQSKKYFREGSFFFKTLRFFNLLEPEKPVLSLSKILVILMMWLFIHVAINNPENLAAVLGAGFGVTASLANYGYRRHMQSRFGTPDLKEFDNLVKYSGEPYSEPTSPNPFGGMVGAPKQEETTDGLEPDPK